PGFLGNSAVSLFASTTLVVGPGTILGALEVLAGGTLSGSGLTVMGSASFLSGSNWNVQLSSTSPSPMLLADGPVSLDGNLNVTLAAGFVPPVGRVFVLIENDGGLQLSGTFANWPDGSIQTIGTVRLKISYSGPAGSVTLTVVP